MQFLLIAYDETDSDAENRRMNARPAHLEKIKGLKKSGAVLFGGAILNDEGKMIGSAILYDLPDRKSMYTLLQDDPYFNSGVWKEVKIEPFRLAKIE